MAVSKKKAATEGKAAAQTKKTAPKTSAKKPAPGASAKKPAAAAKKTAAKKPAAKPAVKTAAKKPVAKPAAKKPAAKKPVAKTVAAKKPVAKKPAAKPAAAVKPAAAKPAPETAAGKTPRAPLRRVIVPKPVIREPTLRGAPPVQPRPPFQPVPTLAQTLAKKKAAKPRFSKDDLDFFKKELVAMRDRILGRSSAMQTAALQGTDDINPEEDGTDAFLRLQTLNQVKSQNELIAKINTALRAIDDGTYGICCNCGELIRKPRLMVLPFAKHCIKCQSELERPRYGRG